MNGTLFSALLSKETFVVTELATQNTKRIEEAMICNVLLMIDRLREFKLNYSAKKNYVDCRYIFTIPYLL